MKTYKIQLLIVIGMLMVSACSLDEEPYGFYSENNFLNTPADAESAISYAYDALTFLEYSRTVFLIGDLPTEEASPKQDASIDRHELNDWVEQNFSTNHSLVNFFKYAYIAINRSNYILDQLPDAQFDQESKDKYMGEAYFLRAWNYFNLVRNFGLVPMHTAYVQTLDQTAAPLATDLDQVYDLIIGDCRKAMELLDVQQATGRADKVAAQSLAAKAYLFIASAKEHDVPKYTDMKKNVSEMYDSAAFFSGKVLFDQSEYGLDDDLLDIYDVEKPDGPEHIFIMSMDRSGTIEGDYSKISKLFIPYVAGGDIYIPDGDGTYTKSHDGWSVFITSDEFYDSYEDGDQRAETLIVSDVYDADGNEIAGYPDNGLLYRFTRKYVDPKFIGDKTSTKPFLIRYSDIALVYAEAVGPTSEGYDQINRIRNRAGLGDLTDGLSVDDFREAVWQERSWELAFEGNRLYDLRRFKRVAEVVDNASDLSAEETTFYPLPQVELNLNQDLN